MSILALILSVLPGILIVLFIYYMDKANPEPKKLIGQAILWGFISVIPGVLLTLGLEALFGVGGEGEPMLQVAIDAFICVGISEEIAKFFFVYFFFFSHKEFDEPLDGIVYSVCVSMGFAILENVLYVAGGGLGLALLRMFTAVPAHAAFAIIVGYYIGLAKFEAPAKRNILLIKGLVLAILVHGAYDFFLFQNAVKELVLVAFVVLIMAMVMSIKLIKKHQAHSEEEENKKDEDDIFDHLIV